MRSIHQLKTALGEHVPAIERIAPALAGRGKVVGRHAGYADRLQFLVEFEDLGMNPDVGRIHVDEDGHVAQDAYRTACSSLLEKVPLLRKSKLQHLLDHALARVLGGGLGEGLRIAAAQRLGPFGPRAGIKRAAQHGVERVIVEPRGLLAAKGFENPPTDRSISCPASADSSSARSRKLPAASRSSGNFCFSTRSKSIAPEPVGKPAMRSAAIQPQSRSTSKLMSAGLPAKAEVAA